MGIHQLDIFQGYKKKKKNKKKLSLNNRLKMKYCNYLSVSKAFLVFIFYFNKFQSLYTHQKRIASWYYYIRFKNRTDVSPPYWHHIDINPPNQHHICVSPLINTIWLYIFLWMFKEQIFRLQSFWVITLNSVSKPLKLFSKFRELKETKQNPIVLF